MKPVQKIDPPVEMAATDGISLRQPSPSEHTTSTLHDPDRGETPPPMGR